MFVCECSVTDVAEKLKAFVEDINANIEELDTRGPVSKYDIPELGIRGRLVNVIIPDICDVTSATHEYLEISESSKLF